MTHGGSLTSSGSRLMRTVDYKVQFLQAKYPQQFQCVDVQRRLADALNLSEDQGTQSRSSVIYDDWRD